jgi:hypothetical protein
LEKPVIAALNDAFDRCFQINEFSPDDTTSKSLDLDLAKNVAAQANVSVTNADIIRAND